MGNGGEPETTWWPHPQPRPLTAASSAVKGWDGVHDDMHQAPLRSAEEGQLGRVHHLLHVVHVPNLARDGHTLKEGLQTITYLVWLPC